MCGTNGLKKLYDREVEKKSKYYDVFDALLRNFCEAEAIAELNADKVVIRGMGRMLLADDELSFISNLFEQQSQHQNIFLSDIIKFKSKERG